MNRVGKRRVCALTCARKVDRMGLIQLYDPPVSGNNGFEFDAIAQSCDSAVDAGARATAETTQRNLARQKTRTRWRMAAVNVLSVL